MMKVSEEVKVSKNNICRNQTMYNQENRHRNTEFPFLCLMVKYKHAKKRTKRAPNGCKNQKPGFGYAPFIFPGLCFIKAIRTKSNQIYDNPIYQQSLLPKCSRLCLW